MSALARSLFPVLNVLGAVLALFAGTMLIPLGVAYFNDEKALAAYDAAFLISFAAGVSTWFITRRFKRELLPRDGFLLVTLVWTVLPGFATLPLLLHMPGLSFTDAYFEAMSGLTTTGATLLRGLDHLPLSINVWRHLLEWIGGLGVIVLAVAVLPMLGVGGTQLFRAEFTGPIKENKLTPRVAETAKGLYLIYLALSAACMLSYWAGGMTLADAFMHMCSTVSLGGFSSHDASFGHWDSPLLEAIAVVFMLICGLNFSMHFLAWRSRSPAPYLRDLEGQAYLLIVGAAVALVAAYLSWHGEYEDWLTSLRYALFNVVSIATTTGYASTDYTRWPMLAPVFMLFLCGICACAGSTGGGIKMIRTVVMLKQAKREFTRILHPRAISPLRLGQQSVENNVIFAVLAFMLIYGASIIVATMALLLADVDVITAFSAAVAMINNLGPGLNDVGPAANYAVLNDFATWVCSFAMLLGRLELMSVLVLLTPTFWRK